MSKGSRSGFLAKCFWRPGLPRPKNHSFPENVWLLGLGTPGLQKTTWPKKHFGIPLMGSTRPRVCIPSRERGHNVVGVHAVPQPLRIRPVFMPMFLSHAPRQSPALNRRVHTRRSAHDAKNGAPKSISTRKVMLLGSKPCRGREATLGFIIHGFWADTTRKPLGRSGTEQGT